MISSSVLQYPSDYDNFILTDNDGAGFLHALSYLFNILILICFIVDFTYIICITHIFTVTYLFRASQ